MKVEPEYIDLTMLMNENVPVFPNDPKPIIEQGATIENDGWNEKRYTLQSHHGTHIDFPLHMIENGKTQNDYEFDKFIGRGKIIDVRGKKEVDEPLDNLVNEGDILLLCTGRSQFVNDFKEYHCDAPIIMDAFADKLIEKRIKVLGLDTWSVDKGKPFTIHKKLLSNDILIVEGLTNLEKLIGKKFKIFIAPMRLDGFDGSPCRVFAEIKEL